MTKADLFDRFSLTPDVAAAAVGITLAEELAERASIIAMLTIQEDRLQADIDARDARLADLAEAERYWQHDADSAPSMEEEFDAAEAKS